MKKPLSAAVLLIMILALLAGCGETPEAQPSDTPTPPVSAAPTSHPTAAPSEEPSAEPYTPPQDGHWYPPYEDELYDPANYNVAAVEETCGHDTAERVVELWYNVNRIWEYGCPLPLEYDIDCNDDYSKLDCPHPDQNMYYRLTNFDTVADRYLTYNEKERMREQSGTFLRTEDGYTWKMGCFKTGYTIAYEILDCQVQSVSSNYMTLNILFDSTWCYKDWGDDPDAYQPDLRWVRMGLQKGGSSSRDVDDRWVVRSYDYVDAYIPMDTKYYWYPCLDNIKVKDSDGQDISRQVQELWCMANLVYDTELPDAFVSDEHDTISRPSSGEWPRYYRRLLDFDRVTDGIFTPHGKTQLFEAMYDLPWFIRTDDGAVYGMIAQMVDYSGPGTVEDCIVRECTPNRMVLDMKCNHEWRAYEGVEGYDPVYYLAQFVIVKDEYGLWKVDDYLYDDTVQGRAARRPDGAAPGTAFCILDKAGRDITTRIVELWQAQYWLRGGKSDFLQVSAQGPGDDGYMRIGNFRKIMDAYFTEAGEAQLFENVVAEPLFDFGPLYEFERRQGGVYRAASFNNRLMFDPTLYGCQVIEQTTDRMVLDLTFDGNRCWDLGDNYQNRRYNDWEYDFEETHARMTIAKVDGKWYIDQAPFDIYGYYPPHREGYDTWFDWDKYNVSVFDADGNDISRRVILLWYNVNSIYSVDSGFPKGFNAYKTHNLVQVLEELPDAGSYGPIDADIFEETTAEYFTAAGRQQLLDARLILYEDAPFYVIRPDGTVWKHTEYKTGWGCAYAIHSCTVRERTSDRMVLAVTIDSGVTTDGYFTEYAEENGMDYEIDYWTADFTIVKEDGKWKVDDYTYFESVGGIKHH